MRGSLIADNSKSRNQETKTRYGVEVQRGSREAAIQPRASQHFVGDGRCRVFVADVMWVKFWMVD